VRPLDLIIPRSCATLQVAEISAKPRPHRGSTEGYSGGNPRLPNSVAPTELSDVDRLISCRYLSPGEIAPIREHVFCRLQYLVDPGDGGWSRRPGEVRHRFGLRSRRVRPRPPSALGLSDTKWRDIPRSFPRRSKYSTMNRAFWAAKIPQAGDMRTLPRRCRRDASLRLFDASCDELAGARALTSTDVNDVNARDDPDTAESASVRATVRKTMSRSTSCGPSRSGER
jgi:hypothetical protein